MSVLLQERQERLERHFGTLAAARTKSGYPLFALEHDLTSVELLEIGAQLCSQMKANLPRSRHWLLWVVYATEFGYNYDGGEYWHPIEDRTLHWDQFSRGQLRDWFRKFQKTFDGVIPSGPWASHFNIIAWPITHAILPKYLQVQFAEALYNLRYNLAQLDTLTAQTVGHLLAKSTWNASSRFREFLQQEELVGRIVLALLSERTVEGQSPIYEPTLRRVVADLEKEQSAREWLKDTRRFVADRLKGGARGNGSYQVDHGTAPLREKAPESAPELRPTLMLRPSSGATWSVVLEVPSFVAAAQLHPDLRAFLRSTRCKVLGAGDTWLPMGWLLSSSQRRVLKRWPGAEVPLIEFEGTHRLLDHLVRSESHLSKGKVWLCRIGTDGLAREIVTRIVRPNHDYIVLSAAALPHRTPLLEACNVDCEGITASHLSVGDSFTTTDVNFINELGLEVARTVRIWPAGLPSRGWDGEGHSEWLTTESACFGIIHDHPLDAFSLRLDNGPETLIETARVGHPVFVRISRLPAGRHTLSVKGRRDSNAYAVPFSPPAEGVVTLEVREPRPWVPGTTSYAGLAISIEPQEATLDAFWGAEATVSVLGPEGRSVTCTITLSNSKGAEILSEQIGVFNLPITRAEWARKFSQFTAAEKRTWVYLEATSGSFSIQGEELGCYTLRLERDTKPVRWICNNRHSTTTLRLVDDTGQDDAATCHFLSSRSPAKRASVATEALLAGYSIHPPGGLFVAEHGTALDTVFVSTPQIEGGLKGLVIEPELHIVDAGTYPIEQLIELIRLWRQARVVGPLAGIRRDHVVSRLVNRFYAKLCGMNWAQAESDFMANPKSAQASQALEHCIGASRGFQVVLQREHEKMNAGMNRAVRWFSEVAKRYAVSSEKNLCELSLRVASQPEHLLEISAKEREDLLRQISANVSLLRGARFLAVLSIADDIGTANSPFPRWRW